METKTNNKKLFSQIGLRLFLGSLIIFGVQILFMFIGGVLAALIPALKNNGDFSFLISMLPMYVVAFPIVFAMFKKIPVQLTGEKKKMKVSHLIAAFFICLATMWIFNLLANLLTKVLGMLIQNEVSNVVETVTSSISLPVNLFVVSICAPIMEELLFRKTLIDRTAQFGEGVALVFSGLVFGLFHGNLVQFAYAFFLGMLLGFIYIKTRNIVYPIILHMIINFFGSFVGTIIMEVSGLGDFASDASMEEITVAMMANPTGLLIFFIYFLFLMGGVIAGIVLFVKNKKRFAPQPGEITIEKGMRFKTIILNVGMILYIIFWLVMIVVQLFS